MFNAPASLHALAVNEMGALWDAHFGNDGLTETDRMVLIAEDRAALEAEITRLRTALDDAEAFIATLQDLLDNARVDSKLWAEACILGKEL